MSQENNVLEIEAMIGLANERLENWHKATKGDHEDYGTLIGDCIVLEGGWDTIDELIRELAWRLSYAQFKKELDYDMYGSHVIEYEQKYYFVEEQ